MAIIQSSIPGTTNFLGSSIEDLVSFLVKLKKRAEETVQNLNNFRIENTDGLSNRITVDTNYFIDLQVRRFIRYRDEFNRLIKELPEQVIEGHCKALKEMCLDVEGSQRLCKKYRDVIEETSNYNEVQIISRVEGEARELVLDLLDIHGFADRLSTFIGLGINSKHKEEIKAASENYKNTKLVRVSKRKFNNDDYETKDILTFVGQDGQGGHIIKVNKYKAFSVPYSISILLLLMTIASKEKSDDGWVTIERFKEDGLIKAQGKAIADKLYSLIHKLRTILKDKIKYPNLFIERAKRHCKYRLSTDPSNIKGKSLKWLRQEYSDILKRLNTHKKKVDLGAEKDSQPKERKIMVPVQPVAVKIE